MKLLFVCLLMVLSSYVFAASSYPVDDIQVLGLQRVSAGTIFSTIKIKANTEVSDAELQTVIRDLFTTGYFDDVTIGRDGKTLIITVKERPVVSTIIIEGNKVIPKEGLLDGLKSIGLAEGEVFKQSALEAISKQLNAQYSALGRYSAEIETLTKPVAQNQIVVGIRIDEGLVAKIKHINIVGNKKYPEAELRDLFSLNTTGVWSWITGSDKYAREKLAGDLERLKSYYLDRGYLQFVVTSTQVSLSPDKETVFITVNIDEGRQYSVNGVDIAGDPVLPEEELQGLVGIKAGDTFSQLLVTRTEQAIEKRLSNEGYSSAQVSGVTDVDEDKQAVKLTFYVKPGEISYVRRITFSGNVGTADYVLRREMRQLEGAPVSAEKLEQSKTRLQRLGLFGEVKLITREVPGTTDQIDVEFIITEQPTASVNFSLGYSGGSGISIGAGLQHNNWLGTGNTFGFNVEKSETETNYNLNFQNPYFTPDGVSRGVRLYYRQRDFDEISVSNYATDAVGLNVSFGYPISETGRLSFGVGVENISVKAGTTTAQEIKGTPDLRSYNDLRDQYVPYSFYQTNIPAAYGSLDNADTNNNGVIEEGDNLPSSSNYDELEIAASSVNDINPSLLADRPEGFLDQYGNSFNNLSLNLGWSDSTFDRGIFPTEGLSQRFDVELATPGGDLQYYKMNYRGDLYFPLAESTALHFKGRLGYGDAYGDIETLPFFENFFAGGVGSVRGFESSSLGPKGTPANAYVAVPAAVTATGAIESIAADDIKYYYVLNEDGNQLLSSIKGDLDTFGGNALVELSAELVFPIPFIKNSDKARLAVFIDSGNVFSTSCGSSQANCGNVDFGKLSVAAGIGVQWLSPVGPMSFNFSAPLVEQPFDKTESFQFSLGRSF